VPIVRGPTFIQTIDTMPKIADIVLLIPCSEKNVGESMSRWLKPSNLCGHMYIHQHAPPNQQLRPNAPALPIPTPNPSPSTLSDQIKYTKHRTNERIPRNSMKTPSYPPTPTSTADTMTMIWIHGLCGKEHQLIKVARVCAGHAGHHAVCACPLCRMLLVVNENAVLCVGRWGSR
jgi:hypothetical protein